MANGPDKTVMTINKEINKRLGLYARFDWKVRQRKFSEKQSRENFIDELLNMYEVAYPDVKKFKVSGDGK